MMKLANCEEFLKSIEEKGVWFAPALPLMDWARCELDLNLIEVEDVGKSYLAFTKEDYVECLPDTQTFMMIVCEYNDTMNGLPFWEDYSRMKTLVKVANKGQTPVYMGIWEDSTYAVPDEF